MKYAICNETFEGWEHERICERIASLGYTGLEIAPFTLAPRITDLSDADRLRLRRVAEANGITIVGLHWLLKNTLGFYLTSPDSDTQQRTGEYFAALAEACAGMGGSLLVLGSPLQRNLLPGVSRSEADDYAIRTISHALPTLEKTGVTMAVEPLGRSETDYLNSAAEAVALIERIGHPKVRLHLDVKAMCDEPIPIPRIIQEHCRHVVHFHANDANRRGPGFGDVAFAPIFSALASSGYDGWVSVEVFDYSPDPETIARESIRYMKAQNAAISLPQVADVG